ncbi:MAG: hypothetical protein KGQ41_07785 [Alphaproteobacteria bacterium]|nr:hypothetical protein [Alphaproteobacteria bacterium]
MTEDTQTPTAPAVADTSSIMRCYVVLAIGMLTAFLPYRIVGIIGMVALVCGTIWAYRLRKQDGELFKNHASWMIRTFWISSLYFLIGMLVSSSIVSSNGDATVLSTITPEMTDEEMAAILLAYKEANKDLILITTLICFGPVMFFVLARFFIGYRKAEKDELIANLKTWLIV